MKREYIVVHTDDDGATGIVFKDPIAGVFKTSSDSYENIVKQLFK